MLTNINLTNSHSDVWVALSSALIYYSPPKDENSDFGFF